MPANTYSIVPSMPSSTVAVQKRIITFLNDIGLVVQQCSLPGSTFLPGISVEGANLLLDPLQLRHPGDLLHEAGHLAVLPPAQRNTLSTDAGEDGGMELGAIAWSYAALVYLELAPEVVFHPDGYNGGSAALCAQFAAGQYLGVPILEWRGLTDWQQPGSANSPTRYPVMKKWLCDQD
jgi:hypothetical protein